MEHKTTEMENYINSLTTVFTRDDGVHVKAIRVLTQHGIYLVRLHVEAQGKLEPPLEFTMEEMRTKIMKIKNYSIAFNGLEIADIITNINQFVRESTAPVLEASDQIGWQRDKDGMISAWKSAASFDLQGMPIVKDIYRSYPSCAGSLDENICYINEYSSTHSVVCQSVLLYGFAAVLAGYFDKCLLLSLSGKSSRGKTTLSKLVVSLFGEPENAKLSTTFNVTLNKMTERLDGLYGCTVLIDDLSLAPDSVKRNLDSMVYILESGKEKERLRTKSFDRDAAQWSTTIIFSAEEPILGFCDPEKEGSVGRLMELNISANDFFNSAEEANKIANLSHKHYGLLGDEFVRRLISNDVINHLHERYQLEAKRVRENYTGPMARIAENVAVVTLTGSLLNELFDFHFNLPEVEKYLMLTAKDNLDNFRISQKENVILTTIYPNLLDYGKQICPDENKGFTDHVVISSQAMKDKFAQIQKQFGYKPIQVKQALKDGNVLFANDGPYSYSGTINGKSFRGTYLYVKDVKDIKEDE